MTPGIGVMTRLRTFSRKSPSKQLDSLSLPFYVVLMDGCAGANEKNKKKIQPPKTLLRLNDRMKSLSKTPSRRILTHVPPKRGQLDSFSLALC